MASFGFSSYSPVSLKVHRSWLAMRTHSDVGTQRMSICALGGMKTEFFGNRVSTTGTKLRSDWNFSGGSRVAVNSEVARFVHSRKSYGISASWIPSSQIASTIFTLGTVAVLPFYTLMVLAPKAKVTKRSMESSIPYVILGLLYAYLLYLSWTPDTIRIMFASKYLLPELPGIAKMFSSEMTLASAWIHLLAIDLFAARFDGLTFLSRMQGKTVMFVGDSLGRNQWESLICMISAAVPQSPTQILKHDPLSAFKFLEYGVTISFYRTPYLVDIDLIQGKRILRLDNIPSNIGNVWKDADVVSFNSGHWWSHKGELQGWDFMETGGSIYQDMDRLVAFEKGLRTWATWVDANIDTTRTRVFFQGISPVHYNPREWNPSSYTKNKNCYGETEPVSGEVYPGPYPDQMKVLQSVISNLKTVPAYLLDITTLSELRKDGHPSIYGGNLSSDQRANPERSSDCSHWCLPGPPDTWNQLFYTAMFF